MGVFKLTVLSCVVDHPDNFLVLLPDDGRAIPGIVVFSVPAGPGLVVVPFAFLPRDVAGRGHFFRASLAITWSADVYHDRPYVSRYTVGDKGYEW